MNAPEKAAQRSETTSSRRRLKQYNHTKEPYQQEHDALFEAIRTHKHYNEAESGALSTTTGILGRMCTYSGQQLAWDDAFNTKLELVPADCSWTSTPPVTQNADGWYPVAIPGRTVAV